MTVKSSNDDRRLTDEEWAKIHSALRQYDHVSDLRDLSVKVSKIVVKRRDTANAGR